MVARAARVRRATFSGSLSLAFLLVTFVAGHAQAPPAPPLPQPAPLAQQPKPVTGFVPSYEILRTVRAAGFDPLAPPLREGSTYVLRATDFRGILMRVVLDARTGIIRDVTRIVPTAPGQYGMMAQPYGPPAYAAEPYGPPAFAAAPYGPPPYGPPEDSEPPVGGIGPGDETISPLPPRPVPLPAMTRPVSARPSVPPLPRPRPAALASQQSDTPAKSQIPAPPAHAANLQPQTGASANAAGANRGAAPVNAAAPGKLPPPPPLND